MKTVKARSGAGSLRKILRLLGKNKPLLFLSILLAAVSVLMQLYVPILFGDAIDAILGPGAVDASAMSASLFRVLVFAGGSAIFVWVMNMINNRLAYRTVQTLRGKAIRHIQDLPLSYLDRHSAGDLVGRVIADTDQLADGLLLGFGQLFTGVVTIVATLVFMLQKSLWITALVVLLTPVSFLVARFIATRSYRMFRKQTETRGEQTGLIEELIGNEKIVQAFGYERRGSDRFRKLNKELEGYSRTAVFFSSLTNPSTRAVNGVIYAVVALAGAWSILHKDLSVGGLTVLLAYANQYMKPFNDISGVVTELQGALACADRVFELIEAEPQTPDPKRELPQAKGEVLLDRVSFSYTPDRPLIRNFSLNTNPGARIAIVGPTGCGKTTLINLLMRFYDVCEGDIYLDGESIYAVSRPSLRKQYGMVLQESWLKHGTVRENIAFGKPEASDKEILAAAREAHSLEFIRRLPQGLDTVLTENSLSQGQKQLLCITRVMLSLPPMLILDEATSSIDTRTELQIQDAFDKLMRGRTCFVVAHRLSTIRSADIILVMKDGQIVEQGSHDELIAQDGFYRELYRSQFSGEQI